MTAFIISFGSNAMDHIADEDMPSVAGAAHAVVQEIIDAGIYVITGALEEKNSTVVATNGTVSAGSRPDAVSGLMIIDVPSLEEAHNWAAKIAVACRCAQEVRAIRPDPELNAMLKKSQKL